MLNNNTYQSSITDSGGSYILRLRKDMLEKLGWFEDDSCEKEVTIFADFDKKILILVASEVVKPVITKIFDDLLSEKSHK